VRRDYELAFILNPEVSEEETRAILDRVEQIVATHDGQVVRVNQWGRRRLAYPIERHRDGFYVFIDMILTPETVTELERTLKVSEVVLRHMMKRRDPKAVQKEREEREARAAAAAAAAATPAAPETAALAGEAEAAPEQVSAEAAQAEVAQEETPVEVAQEQAPIEATQEEAPAEATPEQAPEQTPVASEAEAENASSSVS
jgi:small subunit ribosomal protein S6